MPAGAFEYRAFISYSHKDAAWAQWLVQALETYRVPAELRPAGADPRARGVGRVFRDRDEASASDLRDEIQRALGASEHLIVIASPNSARSRYVELEIHQFAEANRQRERPGQILTLIVDGDPGVSPGPEAVGNECFPPALRGGLLRADGTAFEPLAADARQTGDGRTRALAKLVAGLLDIRYDALVRRDLQRRRRRQWLASAAVVAGLAIAGVVAAVIVNGNLRQEALQQQREAAERDARTLTAVSEATRAQRLLDSGNVADATKLARDILAPGADLPFVPQAYQVLYQAQFQPRSSMNLDITGYYRDRPGAVPLGDGAYLTASDEGTATIWSATRGVLFRRSDLAPDSSPGVAPDGNTVLFMAYDTGLLRFTVATQTWDHIDISSLFQGGNKPYRVAPTDNATFYGCSGNIVFQGKIDADQQMQVGWFKEIEHSCTALRATSEGTAIVGTDAGVTLELSPTMPMATSFTRGASDDFILHVWADAQFVLAASADGTSIYERDNGRLIFTAPGYLEESDLSADGTLAYIKSEEVGMVHLLDLKTKAEKVLDCTCVFVAFRSPGTLVAFSGVGDSMGLASYDVASLQQLGSAVSLKSPPDFLRYLPDSGALLGVRRIGEESVVRLDTRADSTDLREGTEHRGETLYSVAFVGARNVLLQILTGGSGTRLKMATTLVVAGHDGKALAVPDAQIAADHPLTKSGALGANLAVVTTPGPGASLQIVTYDGTSGKQLRNDIALKAPRLGRAQRWLGIDGPATLQILDAMSRATLSVGPGVGSWDIGGNTLAYESDAGLSIATLGDAGLGTPRVSPLPAGRGEFYCVSDDGNWIYDARETGGQTLFERRNAATPDAADSLPMPTDAAIMTIVEAGSLSSARDRTCNASTLAVDGGYGQSVVWEVAAKTISIVSGGVAPPDASTPNAELTAAATAHAMLHYADSTAWLTDPSSGAVLMRLATDGPRVAAGRYLADLGLVALGLEDGTVAVWNMSAPSAPMISLSAHGEPVTMLDYNESSHELLSADSGGTVHIWPLLTTVELLQQTADLAP